MNNLIEIASEIAKLYRLNYVVINTGGGSIHLDSNLVYQLTIIILPLINILNKTKRFISVDTCVAKLSEAMYAFNNQLIKH